MVWRSLRLAGARAARFAVATTGRAELRAAAVDGAQSRRVEPARRVPLEKNRRAGDELQHRVGEQHDDEHVDDAS